MQVEFELTEDDWLAAIHDFRRTTPGQNSPVAQLLQAVLTGGLALLLVAFALRNYIYDVPDIRSQVGMFAAGILAFTCAIYLYLWWNYRDPAIRRQIRRESELSNGADPSLGPLHLTIDENRIAETAPGYNGSIAWSHVTQVTHTPNHLFVYLTRFPESLICYIVPRRAFAIESEFEKFCQTAHGYWEAARQPESSA